MFRQTTTLPGKAQPSLSFEWNQPNDTAGLQQKKLSGEKVKPGSAFAKTMQPSDLTAGKVILSAVYSKH